MLQIRASKKADGAAISEIHASAFGQPEGPEIIDLVDELLQDPTADPFLSLVAEQDGRLVGHVLFTPVTLLGEQQASARILAPLGVAKGAQGAGVGSALVREGLRRLREAGVDLVFVLGHPDYYPRFGFQPAGALGLEAPYPIPAVHADAWMVQALKAGVLGRVRGKVQCADTLDQPRHWTE